MEPNNPANLPASWQFLGSMWWVLHIFVIILIFYVGYAVGKNAATPEADPVDQDELRRKQGESAAENAKM
ncbi:MAG: hypothetical protein ACFCU1_12270 [Sumerlaeia bacterium]